MKILKLFTKASFLLIMFCFANSVLAASEYYFTNTVNTDPTELGNYFTDVALTTPAIVLPDNTTEKVYITAGSTYTGNANFIQDATNKGTITGNATFNDDSSNQPTGVIQSDATFNQQSINHGAVNGLADFLTSAKNIGTVNGANFWNDTENQGTVTTQAVFNDQSWNTGTIQGDGIFKNSSHNDNAVNGNATFYEDATENNGTVTGTKIRIYQIAAAPGRDFTGWTVVADGVVVDITGATKDNTTIYNTLNGGSFLNTVAPVFSYVNYSALVLRYDSNFDATSLPNTTDFNLLVNGINRTISSINISNNLITLTLSSPVISSDTISLDYVSGVNPLKIQGLNIPNFTNLNIIYRIPTGNNPDYFLTIGNRLYVGNVFSNSVTVIDKYTDAVVANIPVGIAPFYMASVGNYLYVNNSGSNSMTIIDLRTNAIVNTINGVISPYTSKIIGNKMYTTAPDFGNTLLNVIDISTNTILTPINLPATHAYWSVILGNKLYVGMGGSNYVAMVNSIDDSVSTITFPGATTGRLVTIGSKLYVSGLAGVLYVVDTTNNSVLSPISLSGGCNERDLLVSGYYVYAICNQGNVSVVDSRLDTETTNIISSLGANYGAVVNKYVYLGNGIVINTITNTLDYLNNNSNSGAFVGVSGHKAYVMDGGNNNFVRVFDTTIIPSLPNLTSFSTTSSSGTYTPGQTIPINANFGRTLLAGSTMTVEMNNGAMVTLSQVSGQTLTGTYTIGANEETIDLAVKRVVSANVSDNAGHTRASYDLPSSEGNFIGENSFITRNLGDNKNIIIGSYPAFDTGSHPYQLTSPINGYIYVANQGSNSVSVLKESDKSLLTTIPVGQEPYGLSTAVVGGTTFVYVANVNSDDVSVINTTTNTVVATISVGVKPYYVATIGTNVYVTNGQSNTVSVINANTNTVTNTISVGSYPRGIKAHATDLYVANYGDPNYSGGNYISVIDSLTNTVTDTIILPGGSTGPRGVATLGSKVYTANYRSNNISVIDTATNTITDTIAVGAGPRGIIGLGNKLYVENFDEGTISVINTATNTVTKTINAGSSPAGMSLSGTNIYFSSFQDDKVYTLDTLTDTVTTAAQAIVPPVVSPGGGGSSGGGGVVYCTKLITTNCIQQVVADPKVITPTTPAPTPKPSLEATKTYISPLDNTTQSCNPFRTYLKLGSKTNSVKEVTLWQSFLNKYHNEKLTISGIYNTNTIDAIKRFQDKYKSEILTPWNLHTPTGYTYKTTRAKANSLLGCSEGTLLLENGKKIEIK